MANQAKITRLTERLQDLNERLATVQSLEDSDNKTVRLNFIQERITVVTQKLNAAQLEP